MAKENTKVIDKKETIRTYYKYVSSEKQTVYFPSQALAEAGVNGVKWLTGAANYAITGPSTVLLNTGTLITFDVGENTSGIRWIGFIGVVVPDRYPGTSLINIQCSTDNVNWTTVSSRFGGRGDYLNNPLRISYPNSYRYIRFTASNDDGSYPYGGIYNLRLGYMARYTQTSTAEDYDFYTEEEGYCVSLDKVTRYYKYTDQFNGSGYRRLGFTSAYGNYQSSSALGNISLQESQIYSSRDECFAYSTGGTYKFMFTNPVGTPITLRVTAATDRSSISNSVRAILADGSEVSVASCSNGYQQSSSNSGTIQSSQKVIGIAGTIGLAWHDDHYTGFNWSVSGSATPAGYYYTGMAGSYLTMSSVPLISTAQSWEFCTKYTHTGKSSGDNVILGQSTATYTSPGLYVVASDEVWVDLSSNGTSWNLYNGTIGLTLQRGQTYWLRFGFTGSRYYVDYNTDGSETYTRVNFLTSSTKCTCTTAPMLMNSAWNTSTRYAVGPIDLKETYLKIEDKVTWRALKLVEALSSDYDIAIEEEGLGYCAIKTF